MPFSFPSGTDLNPRAWVDVRASESTLIGTGAMSIAAWVWYDPRWNDGTQREIVCFNDGAGSNSQTYFGITANLTLEFARKFTTTDGNWLGLNLTPRANCPIPTGRWTFVGVTHDGGTTNKADFFMWDPVDGLFYAGANNSYGPTPPVGTPSVPGVATWIGRNTYRVWPGGIAHVQIWKRTLTSLEMQQAMRRPGSVRSSLTGYWPLERTAEDRSPTKGHGTLYGAVRRDAGKIPRLPRFVSIARQSRFRPTYDAIGAAAPPPPPATGMRALLAGELAQAQSFDSDYYVKLEVQNGSGTWIDVGAALGRKWIVNASWGETVDVKVMQVTFTLWQEMGGNSLSPLMTASVLNRDDALAYAPLLNVGRLVRASTATMPHLVPLDVAKYRKLLDGRIDDVRQADSLDGVGPITIICSDLGGWLMDMQIETSGIQYGTTPIGTALETVLQNVLTANIPVGEPAVTLLKQSTSNFAVTDWKQGDTKVLDALSTLVLDSTGEDIRYRYDATHVSRLTWFNPNRTRTTVDATFGPNQYVLRQLDLAIANIRNAGEMSYQGGVAKATAPSSITAFRRRFFRLPASPLITTLVDAQKVIDAVVNDLSAPPGEAAADIPFFWPVQLWDRYTFQANGRQYDTDQTFAVLGYQHTIEHGQGSTTLTLTARIVGAYAAWLARLRRVLDDASASLSKVTWTETATEEIVTFIRGAAVTEVWAAYAVIAAPVQATDFDTRVAPFVSPLPAGATTFHVPRPPDGFVTLVQLEPRRADLAAGPVVRFPITAAPQVPHVELDDAESATVGTQWWKITERGIPVTTVQVQTQIGTVFSDWGSPTRSAGAASVVRGGLLGVGEYEHDVTLDATRQSWIMPRLTLGNGAPPIVLGPFGFDRDKIPRLISVIPVGTVVTVTGDSGDTKAVGLYSTTRAWKMEADGASAAFDVTIADASGNAGLASGSVDTFTAKALSDPVAYIGGGTVAATQDVIVSNGAAPSSATWVTVQAIAPTTNGDDTLTIKLKASSAPALWIVKLFIANPSTVTAIDHTADVAPTLTAPPTVLSSYTYATGNARTAGGHSMLRTVSVRAELRNGSGVVQASTTVSASWYTGGAL